MKRFGYFLSLLLIFGSIKTLGQGFTRIYIPWLKTYINESCEAGKNENAYVELYAENNSIIKFYFLNMDGRGYHERYPNSSRDVSYHQFTLKLKGWHDDCGTSTNHETSIPIDAQTNKIPLTKNEVVEFGFYSDNGWNRGSYVKFQTCFFPSKPQLYSKGNGLRI